MTRLALCLLVLVPWIATAQAPTNGQLCERFVANPARQPDLRSRMQVLARGSDASVAAFAQGCLLVADARWNDAAKAFERAVQADDRSSENHYWLGRTYGVQVLTASVLRQPALARRTRASLERAVELDPGNLDARAALMQYYLRAPGIVGGSVAKARQQVAEVRRRNAYRGGQLAATVERREKNWTAAVQEYERLIAQYPDSAAPWSSLASAYGDQKRWDDAFRTIDRFLAAHPRELLAQYAIGRAAGESGQQLERGAAALRLYIAGATPGPGEPTVATAHLRLGTVHERQGKKDLARAEYETALRLEPTLEAAREALKRLR